MWFVGNWKMNGNVGLVQDFLKGEWPAHHLVSICPPYPYLSYFKGTTSLILGAQNCHECTAGAYTGEVSPYMLKELGVELVILGHSERRQYAGESSAHVQRKVRQAVSAGLKPLLCVGEPESVRKEGKAVDFVLSQLRNSTPPDLKGEILIAYEPVWAIGTGLLPSLEEIEEMHLVLKKEVACYLGQGAPILYGGSVKPENVCPIAELEGVDGVLVGGASLNVKTFQALIEACGQEA